MYVFFFKLLLVFVAVAAAAAVVVAVVVVVYYYYCDCIIWFQCERRNSTVMKYITNDTSWAL